MSTRYNATCKSHTNTFSVIFMACFWDGIGIGISESVCLGKWQRHSLTPCRYRPSIHCDSNFEIRPQPRDFRDSTTEHHANQSHKLVYTTCGVANATGRRGTRGTVRVRRLSLSRHRHRYRTGTCAVPACRYRPVTVSLPLRSRWGHARTLTFSRRRFFTDLCIKNLNQANCAHSCYDRAWHRSQRASRVGRHDGPRPLHCAHAGLAS